MGNYIRRADVGFLILLVFLLLFSGGETGSHAQQPPTLGLPPGVPAAPRPVPQPARPAQAGPVRDTRPTTGSARIRGRVVIADTMQPARRATVRLSAPEMRNQRTVMTDLDGRYDATNLPAGRYTISASKNGLVGLSYGQTRPTVPAQVVVLTDRQEATGIDLTLLRGGVISGRVLDDFGDPVSGVGLMVLRVAFQQGQQRLTQVGQRATTNDIGEYRLFGLQAGSYYIAATPQVNNAQPNVDVPPQERSGFAPVFYPGTVDPSTAQKVTIGFGQTLPEINFSLVGVRLAQLSGTAVDSQGRPMTAGSINAVRRGRVQGLQQHSGQLKQDGTFVIANVAPGDYILRANGRPQPSGPVAPGAPRPPASRPEVATGRVTVSGDDMTGIHLAPVPPVTVTGRVIFDNPSAAASLKASGIRLNANLLTTGEDPGGQPNPPNPPMLKEDFSFELRLAPGAYILRPNLSRESPPQDQQSSFAPPPTPPQQPSNAAPAWTLKALRVNGMDVTNTGLEVRPGDSVSGVEIEMTNQPPKVSGVVTTGNSSSANGFTVLIFPQDEALWTAPGPGLFSQMRADLSGEFTTQSLRPGRYYALAVYELELGTANDPEFLRNASPRAQSFSLGEGENKRLELRGQLR